MSLIETIKRRQLEKVARHAASADPALQQAVERGQLPAALVSPTYEQYATDVVSDRLKSRRINPRDAEAVRQQILDQTKPDQQLLEDEALKHETGHKLMAPSTAGGVAGTLAMGASVPLAIHHAPRLLGRIPAGAMSLGGALKSVVAPAFLPMSAAMEVGTNYLTAPLSDPQYQRGERSFAGSVGKAYSDSADTVGDRGAELRARYGVAGVPGQMLHGIMNPLASFGYLGKSLMGKSGAALLKRAHDAVARENA